jgi:16S rRNA (uracil1498-N3)-methyltransferase
MAYFFLPECATGTTELPRDESRHAVKSLRLRNEDEINILNGKGDVFAARLINADEKKSIIQIEKSLHFDQKLPRLNVAISPLKFTDRLELFIEKACEMGVYSITPLVCNRTEKKHVNKARLERVMISAIKQSGNPYLPILNDATDFSHFIESDKSASRLIAHCEESQKNRLTEIEFGESVSVLIGPEGDFTQEETKEAITAGYIPITLGDNTLRAESAGITVCAYFHLIK